MFIRKHETIRDGLNRHYVKFISRFNKKHIKIDCVEKYLINLGIKKNDTIIVHCSWRGCYSFDFSPEEFIDLLLKIIGKNGTLLMPCYGYSKDYFDVINTPSHAGVLSEVFRNYVGVQRSVFPDSAMCGIGKNAKDILSNHIKSKYAFDEFSPYYIAINKYDAKILLVGMGKNPHKISAFHCATISSLYDNEFYFNVYKKECVATIVKENGDIIKKTS